MSSRDDCQREGVSPGVHDFFHGQPIAGRSPRDLEGRPTDEEEELRRRGALRKNLRESYTFLNCCCPCLVKVLVDRTMSRKLDKPEGRESVRESQMDSEARKKRKADRARRKVERAKEKLQRAKDKVRLLEVDKEKARSFTDINLITAPSPVLQRKSPLALAAGVGTISDAVVRPPANAGNALPQAVKEPAPTHSSSSKASSSSSSSSSTSLPSTLTEVTTAESTLSSSATSAASCSDFSVQRLSDDSALFKMRRRDEKLLETARENEVLELLSTLREAALRVDEAMEDFGEDFAAFVFKRSLKAMVAKSEHFYYPFFVHQKEIPKTLNVKADAAALSKLELRSVLASMPRLLSKMANATWLVMDDWESERAPPGRPDLNARFADAYYAVDELRRQAKRVTKRLGMAWPATEDYKVENWMPSLIASPRSLKTRMERDWTVYRDTRNAAQFWADYFQSVFENPRRAALLADAFWTSKKQNPV